MARPKKVKDPVVDEIQDTELEGEESGTYFDYTDTAYLPVYNETRKAYDMLVIRIDSDTDQAVVEREETRYSSIPRAMLDVNLRIEEELRKRGGK